MSPCENYVRLLRTNGEMQTFFCVLLCLSYENSWDIPLDVAVNSAISKYIALFYIL